MRSKGLYCRWLPAPEEDIRPEAIKYTGGTSKGKRKYLEGTTGEEDPYIAVGLQLNGTRSNVTNSLNLPRNLNTIQVIL